MAENEVQDDVNDPALETKLPRYSYPIVLRSDFSNEEKKREIVDLCQIACEKHAAAEKRQNERNNQAAAKMIKASFVPIKLEASLMKASMFQEVLDKKMDGPFNVVVGESFTFDIEYLQHSLLYMLFGGYLSVCVWKCV